MDPQRLIDIYYPEGSRLRDIYIAHCRSVAALALAIARSRKLALDPAQIKAAAMIHDIGIALTDAPGIECRGSAPYIAHGPIGAELLRSSGAPEWMARVAERHTGSGIGKLVPETELEKLICYADKFYSKSGDMKRKPLERVRASLARFGADSLARFDALHAQFACKPDTL